jgi:DNA-binding winged helix-turn-helix (wHTH) protein/tetratricopeptide (TPR) repeat protein
MPVDTRENAAELSFGEFTLDPIDERLRGPAGPVKLGNKAFRLLLLLAGQPGRLVTKEDLFSSVWDGTIVSEAALTSAMKELRRALGDDTKTPRFIESVYGRGYRFVAAVTRTEPSAPRLPAAATTPPGDAELPKGGRAAGEVGKPPLLYIPAIDDSAVRAGHPHLALVLREEILFALSRFRDIRLVSDAELSAAPAASDCGDRDYQLSVVLLEVGGIRAFAKLSRLASQAIVWADSITLPAEAVGQCVEQLVRRIAAAALPRLHEDVMRNLPDMPSAAYDVYFANKLKMRNVAGVAEARAIAAEWETLIAEHPRFVQAYAPLVRLYNTDFCYTGLGTSRADERRRAHELARRALMLDPGESHLHTVNGWCELWAGAAHRAAEHFEEALQLNPYNKARLIEAATAFMFLGDLDRAAALLERCRNLTPFPTEAPYEEEGFLHLLRGEYEAAASRLALATRTHPDDSATGGPTVMSELYTLLVAAGEGRRGPGGARLRLARPDGAPLVRIGAVRRGGDQGLGALPPPVPVGAGPQALRGPPRQGPFGGGGLAARPRQSAREDRLHRRRAHPRSRPRVECACERGLGIEALERNMRRLEQCAKLTARLQGGPAPVDIMDAARPLQDPARLGRCEPPAADQARQGRPHFDERNRERLPLLFGRSVDQRDFVVPDERAARIGAVDRADTLHAERRHLRRAQRADTARADHPRAGGEREQDFLVADGRPVIEIAVDEADGKLGARFEAEDIPRFRGRTPGRAFEARAGGGRKRRACEDDDLHRFASRLVRFRDPRPGTNAFTTASPSRSRPSCFTATEE